MEMSTFPLRLPFNAQVLTLSCLLLGFATVYAIRRSKNDAQAANYRLDEDSTEGKSKGGEK